MYKHCILHLFEKRLMHKLIFPDWEGQMKINTLAYKVLQGNINVIRKVLDPNYFQAQVSFTRPAQSTLFIKINITYEYVYIYIYITLKIAIVLSRK